jgi:hypothetical protein
MPTIRIEDDVFAGLQQLAKPFTDTPNSVIRRLLEQAGIPVGPAGKPDGAPEAGSANARSKNMGQPVYEKYLLHVLAHQFNGEGHKKEVCKAVVELMERHGLIGEDEREVMQSGETRAEYSIGWSRFALKGRGLIADNSPRGVWALTAQGRDEGQRTEL